MVERIFKRFGPTRSCAAKDPAGVFVFTGGSCFFTKKIVGPVDPDHAATVSVLRGFLRTSRAGKRLPLERPATGMRFKVYSLRFNVGYTDDWSY